MSASIGTLNLKIVASPQGLVAGLNNAAARIKGFAAQAGATLAGIGSGLVRGLGHVGLAFQGLRGLVDVATKPLKLAAEFEMVEAALTGLMGGADKAKSFFADIQQFAVVTPFKSKDLLTASQRLASVGVKTEDLLPTLRVLGDLAAGDAERLSHIALAYSQIVAKGKLAGQEINQLAEAGVNIRGELARYLGVTAAELEALQEAGKVTAADVTSVFIRMTGAGGAFFGAMERGSKTIGGLWSTLVDNLELTLAGIGDALVKGLDLKNVIARIIEFSDTVRANIEAVLPFFQGLGYTLQNVWAFWSEAWTSLGQPVFAVVSEWLSGLIPAGVRFGDVWLNSLELAAGGFAYLLDSVYEFGERVANAIIKPFTEAMSFILSHAATVLTVLADKVPAWLGGDRFRELAGGIKEAADFAGILDEKFGGVGPGLGAEKKVKDFFERVRGRLVGGPGAPMPGLNVPGLTAPTAGGAAPKNEVKLAGAAEFGSKEAASILAKATGAAITDKALSEQKRQTELMKEANKKFEAIEKAARDAFGGVVNFPF